jgi:O-acetyl-ADP-ribose deacetylase
MRAVLGNIVNEKTDAIVNAANESLLGGGGVDGAIHRAAGSGLLEECRALGGCKTGDAKATSGHGLGARWIFHAVGPVWKGGGAGEDEALTSCYRRCLALAAEKGAKTIAFPAISTGVFGFPSERAASIACREVRAFLEKAPGLEVRFVCFDRETYDIYLRLLGQPE